ncbi:MAG: DUF3108 domain-containing protein [Coxiellaceae bacterium]|nr:DUF3108 domain-containing protein [Coxiellaceae bacterium]
MFKYKIIFLFLFGLGAITSAYSYCNLPNSTATYDIYSRKSHVGKVLETITLHKRHFDVKNSTKIGFFLLSDTLKQSSEGTFDKDNIQPTAYELSDLNKKTNNFINFYPDRSSIRGTYESNVFEIKQSHWPIYDPLSYQLALRCELMKGNFHEKRMRVFDKKRVHFYDLKLVSNNQTINTSIGKLKTVELKLLVLPERVFALLWFAKFRHMTLVQSSVVNLGKNSVFSSIKSLKQKFKP